MQKVYEFAGSLDDCIKELNRFVRNRHTIIVELNPVYNEERLRIVWDDGVNNPPANLIFLGDEIIGEWVNYNMYTYQEDKKYKWKGKINKKVFNLPFEKKFDLTK